MSVAVGVSQLVGNRAQEEVASLRVQLIQQLLINVHRGGMGNGRRALGSLGVKLSNAVDADVQDQCVDHGHVVLGTARINILNIRVRCQDLSNVVQERGLLTCAKVVVDVSLEGHSETSGIV